MPASFRRLDISLSKLIFGPHFHCEAKVGDFGSDKAATAVYVGVLFHRRGLELGAAVMATAAEYRIMAEECFEWAREARDESVRGHYAKLGHIWLGCAAQAELRSGAISPSEPKVARKVA